MADAYMAQKQNYGTLELNEEMTAVIERATERAGRLGLHTVHIFNKDVIDGSLCHRSGYFEEKVEAEIFAKSHLDRISGQKVTAIILLDNALYGGKFVENDARDFMAAGKVPMVLRTRMYHFYPFNIFEGEVFLPGIGKAFANIQVNSHGEKITFNDDVECHFYKRPYADITDVDEDELAVEYPEIARQLEELWNAEPVFVDDDSTWKEV